MLFHAKEDLTITCWLILLKGKNYNDILPGWPPDGFDPQTSSVNIIVV